MSCFSFVYTKVEIHPRTISCTLIETPFDHRYCKTNRCFEQIAWLALSDVFTLQETCFLDYWFKRVVILLSGTLTTGVSFSMVFVFSDFRILHLNNYKWSVCFFEAPVIPCLGGSGACVLIWKAKREVFCKRCECVRERTRRKTRGELCQIRCAISNLFFYTFCVEASVSMKMRSELIRLIALNHCSYKHHHHDVTILGPTRHV